MLNQLKVDPFLVLFMLNGVLAILVAALLVYFAPIAIVKKKKPFFLLLVSLGVFIPFLGILLALVLVTFLKLYTKNFTPILINVFPQVEYARRNVIKSASYGTGWANVRLESPSFSQAERTEALLSLTRGRPRDANRIYNKLVADDTEEIRVCSFSLLENQQDLLQQHLHRLLKKYQQATTNQAEDAPLKPHAATLAKQIALTYWELVYLNLSQHELRDIFLEQSYVFATKAHAVLPDDTALLILFSRLKIEKGHADESVTYLLAAEKWHAPTSKVLPYLAEIAYKHKDYVAVNHYLNTDTSLQYLFKLNKVVHFWCQNDYSRIPAKCG